MNTSYDFQPHMWTVSGNGTSNDFKVTDSAQYSQIAFVNCDKVTGAVKSKLGQCNAGGGLTFHTTSLNVWKTSDTVEKPYQFFSADVYTSVAIAGQEALQKLIDEVTVRINADRFGGAIAETRMSVPCVALLGND